MDLQWGNRCSGATDPPPPQGTNGSGSSNEPNPRLASDNINASESSSSDHLSKNIETAIPALNLFDPDDAFRALPCSTSSSSAASSEDLFQVVPNGLVKPNTYVYFAGKLDDLSQSSSKEYVSSDSSAMFESFGAPSSAAVSDVTRASTEQFLSSTQSPPPQVMDRSGGYEPCRIPSSVFSRSKSSTPVEWSIASNESLFSIHIGNNSFSRDHIIKWNSDEMRKSEELRKFTEQIPFSPEPSEGVVVVMPDDDPTADVERIFKANQKTVGFVEETDAGRTKEKKVNKAAGPPNSSCHSDESGTSTKSFSFPIGKKSERPKRNCTSWMRKMFLCGRKKSSCFCSNCSWPSCYCCKWPSCSCPSCSSCTSCYSWNCCRKQIGPNTLTEVDRSDPIKIDGMKYTQQQVQFQPPYVKKPVIVPTSRPSSKRCCGSCSSCRGSCSCFRCCCSWRSCFSWWSCSFWRSCCSWWSCSSCRSCCSGWSCSSCRSCCSGLSCSPCRSCCSGWSCSSCRSCCSGWSCSSCRSCCSGWSCSSCRSCCSWRSCFSCQSCCSWISCRSCGSCCGCYSSFSCRLRSCCCRCC